MKHNILLPLILLMALLVPDAAMAQEQNRLFTPAMTVPRGKQVVLPVYVTNTAEITGIQFDIAAPEGVTFRPGDVAMTVRRTDHEAAASIVDGKCRVMVWSATNSPIQGQSGQLLSVPVTIGNGFADRQELSLTFTDVVLCISDGTNVLTASDCAPLTVADSPDLVPADVISADPTIVPGGKLQLSWTVSNTGSVATGGGWREQIALVSGSVEKIIGTTYFDGTLGTGASMSRNAEIELPVALALDGTAQLSVWIIPNSDSGESVAAQGNNTARSGDITISKRLVLTPAESAVAENQGTPVRMTVTRSGYTTDEAVFAIATDTPERLDVPASVTIPEGNSSAVFYVQPIDDDILNSSADATLTLTGTDGYDDVAATFTIDDDDPADFTLTASSTDITEGDTFQLTIATNRVTDTPVEVKLGSPDASHFTFPADIVIPAGENSVTVDITATDDDIPRSFIGTEIKVSSARHNTASLEVTIDDNDIPEIALDLSTLRISEGDGSNAILATVTRTGVTGNRVTIKFSDNCPNTLYYPESIVMEKGVQKMQFAIGVIDNAEVDGERSVTLTAAVYLSSCNCAADGESGGSVSVDVSVLDNDGPTLSATSSNATVREGDTFTITVSRNTDTSEALALHLSSDKDDMLQYQHEATIPAGEKSAAVEITALSNDVSGDGTTIAFTVTASGYTDGICWVMISDQTLPDATVESLTLNPGSPEVGSEAMLSITVANKGVAAIPSTIANICIDGSSDPVTKFYFHDPIEPGQTVSLSKTIRLDGAIGTHRLTATVNPDNSMQELLYTNNSATETYSLLPTFRASVKADKAVYAPGETVMLTGKAEGSAGANAEVEVYLINTGYRQTFTVTTDATGAFSLSYNPPEYLPGYYTAGACYPGENLRETQAEFDVYGAIPGSGFSQCDMTVGDTQTCTLTVKNPGRLDLTGLKCGLVKSADNLSVTAACPSVIPAGQSADITFTVKADAPSTGEDWEETEMLLTTAEGVELSYSIFGYSRPTTGKLKADCSKINTTMVKGTTREYQFTVSNTGRGETGKIHVVLPDAPWMRTATPSEMASLATGESATVVLSLTPTDDLPLNLSVSGSISLTCDNGTGCSIPFSIENVSESTGTLSVDVCDEYTYYTAEQPHVADAGVVVRHPVTSAIVAQGKTGADGVFSIEIPEGFYTLEVTESKHDSYSGSVEVAPGRVNTKLVNLSYQAITIDWKVDETTVDDEYEIVSTVKFETNVPKPVVEVIMPTDIPGEELIANGSYMFNAIVTNKGLITAEDVEVTVPEIDGVTGTILVPVPFDLRAGESRSIPIRLDYTAPAEQTAETDRKQLRSRSLGPCNVNSYTIYYWDCGTDRKWHQFAYTIRVLACGHPGSQNQSPSNNQSSPLRLPTWSGPHHGPGGGSLDGGGGVPSALEWLARPYTGPDDCEPCQNTFLLKLVKCAAGDIPVLGTVLDAYDCYEKALECYDTWPESSARERAECIMDALEDCGLTPETPDPLCLEPVMEPCELTPDQAVNSKAPRTVNSRESSGYASYIVEFQNNIRPAVDAYHLLMDYSIERFGSKKWLNITDEELYTFTQVMKESLSDGKITAEGRERLHQFRPESLSNADVDAYIVRFNNTVDPSYTGDNQMSIDRMRELLTQVKDLAADARAKGYKGLGDLLVSEFESVQKQAEEYSNNSVCATITLQFTQNLVMTRQAFRGTLTVYNGNKEKPMEDVVLTLDVRDANGRVATSHEFQMNAESLDKFEGELDLGAGWSLAADETGVATVLFIPTKYAAPDEPMEYSFGGELSYRDPFSGLKVTRSLYPVTLTVKPSPELDLTYFMQRDIYGDDALTDDVVEPTIPAEFSLLINNTGRGDATDVRMITQQPKIIENEKGLQIDFEILSSQLNGKESTLALGGSVSTDFGDIPSGSTAYAQWWFTSTLLGHFVDYSVDATHLTSYGNPDLSLLNNVTIHELIHSLNLGETDGRIDKGFLVNDIVDRNDAPDMLYLTDGTIESVAVTEDVTIERIDDDTWQLTVTATTPGWNYGNLLDPTYGRRNVIAVTADDGRQIDPRNFWQTDRTMPDGKEPLYENRLHFADKFTAGTQSYRITFDHRPDTELEVDKFTGIPEAGTCAVAPLECIGVTFNKPIDASTFTADDLTVVCQGLQVSDLSTVSIEPVSDTEYTIRLGDASLANGYYVLTVATGGITATDGFNGINGKSAGWVQFADGKVASVVRVEPEGTATVTPGSGQIDYNVPAHFAAVPAEGYDFVSWTVNGEEISTKPDLDFTPTDNVTIVARTQRSRFNVTVEAGNGGWTEGDPSAIYDYGTEIEATALPWSRFEFVRWTLDGEPFSTDPTIRFTVKAHAKLEAEFVRREIADITVALNEGWNWISSNVADDDFVNPRAFFGPVYSKLEAVIGPNGSLQRNGNTLTGDLEAIIPATYQVKVSQNCTLELAAEVMSVNNDITLHSGWNLITYLPTVPQSVDDAMAGLDAAENDLLKDHTDFTVFADGSWHGTLEQMNPWGGYFYMSESDATFRYSGMAPTAMPRGYYRMIASTDGAWSVDPHRYVDNMSIIAEVIDQGAAMAPESYQIGAFCGDECRGVSTVVEGRHFLTVHGNEGDRFQFHVRDIASGQVYTVERFFEVANTLAGTYAEPLALDITTSGLRLTSASALRVLPNPTHGIVHVAGDTGTATALRIYSMSGRLCYETTDIDAAIDLTHLPAGTYIVTIDTAAGTVRTKLVKVP